MHGVKRFDDFRRSLGIARNTLSDRLARLVQNDILAREFYQHNPPRCEYLLTERGRDLFPVITAILVWGDKWLDGGAGAPIALFHETGAPAHDLTPQLVCTTCGAPVRHVDTQFCVGPGYPDDVAPDRDLRSRLALVPGEDGGRAHAGREQSRAGSNSVSARRTRRGR
jgi:DNA-binding HxlR family transcriptional regulator